MFGKNPKPTPATPAPATAPAAKPKQNQDQKIRSAKVVTLIGPGTTVEGDIQFSGGLHVEGTVKGNLIAENDDSTLILNEQGRIQGEVRVPSMVLNGSIDGDVFANGKVELFEKSRICGDVYYNLLEMAVGAEVNGKLVRQKPAEVPPPAPVAPEVVEEAEKPLEE